MDRWRRHFPRQFGNPGEHLTMQRANVQVRRPGAAPGPPQKDRGCAVQARDRRQDPSRRQHARTRAPTVTLQNTSTGATCRPASSATGQAPLSPARHASGEFHSHRSSSVGLDLTMYSRPICFQTLALFLANSRSCPGVGLPASRIGSSIRKPLPLQASPAKPALP
jgi:hypothetical protein